MTPSSSSSYAPRGRAT